jgi:CheY-like chemotaxis protein
MPCYKAAGNTSLSFIAREQRRHPSHPLSWNQLNYHWWKGAELSRIKLVVADDSDGFRRALVRFLSNYFSVLDAVADGRELINSATLVNPDVIVSDVCMPIFTGLEAMRELYANGLKIPFVFVSGGENTLGDHVSFVSKDKIAHQLVPAIHQSVSGSPFVSHRPLVSDDRRPGPVLLG